MLPQNASEKSTHGKAWFQYVIHVNHFNNPNFNNFRISISIVSFSIIMITFIWHLVLIKYDLQNHDCSPESNITKIENNFWIFVNTLN